MESPVAAPSAGLPPGVEAGDLLKRFLAHVIDSIVPGVVIGICSGISAGMDPGAGSVILTLIGVLVALGWFVFTWWMFATKAAGPGMRLMHLQLVGLADGRPIGWVRYLLRSLVLGVLMGTGLGAILLIVFLIMHPRRQGWHDLVANSVVIGERTLAPSQAPQQSVDQGQPQQSAPESQQSAPQFQQSAPQFQQDGPPQQGAPAAYGPQTSPYRQPSAQSGASAPPPENQPSYGQSQGSAPEPAQPQRAAADPQAPGSADPYGRSQGSASERAGQPIAPQGQVHAPAPVTAPPPPVSPSAPISYPTGAAAGAAGAAGAAAGAGAGAAAAANGPGPDAPSGRQAEAAQIPYDGRPLDQGWGIQLDDGREIAIEGLALLGRNPQPRDGEAGANLIKFADDTRTVSKTHLAIGVDANGPYVMDRGSTNGSSITNEFGVTKPCRAGDVVQVKNGLVVSFGDHWLKITRN